MMKTAKMMKEIKPVDIPNRDFVTGYLAALHDTDLKNQNFLHYRNNNRKMMIEAFMTLDYQWRN